ncbi:unnamed protein product, partial [Owenia fusiformis]
LAESLGKISLRLVSFVNPGGKGDNGHCCDGRGIICSSKCDHQFKICVDYLNGTADLDSCAFGKFETGVISNEDTIQFGDDISGLSNPIEIPFNNYAGGFLVKIDVWDDDSNFLFNRNDHVDTIAYAFNEPAPATNRNMLVNGRTTIELGISVTCDANFYGPNCLVFCDSSLGNYNCDSSNGDKVCFEGWEGDDCSVRITTTTTTTTTMAPTTTTETYGENADCASFGGNMVSVRRIQPQGVAEPFNVLCRGEWTVIQNRFNGREIFNRLWEDYKNGFGKNFSMSTDFWLGLEKVYRLTNQKKYKLNIKMTDAADRVHEANYDHFYVGNEADGYRLHLEGFSGNAGDALSYCGGSSCGGMSNGQKFSTRDRDNDNWAGNCAERYNSGWWYNNCFWANLNGRYVTHPRFWPKCPGRKCISWRTIPGYENYSLLKVTMAIAPNLESTSVE